MIKKGQTIAGSLVKPLLVKHNGCKQSHPCFGACPIVTNSLTNAKSIMAARRPDISLLFSFMHVIPCTCPKKACRAIFVIVAACVAMKVIDSSACSRPKSKGVVGAALKENNTLSTPLKAHLSVMTPKFPDMLHCPAHTSESMTAASWLPLACDLHTASTY